MKRRTFIKIGSAAVGSGFLAGPVFSLSSARTFVCGYPKEVWSNSPVFVRAATAFAEAVELYTFGRLRIELTPQVSGVATPFALSSPSMRSQLDSALSFPLRATPSGMPSDEKLSWLLNETGARFLDDVYSGIGIKPLFIGMGVSTHGALVRTSSFARPRFWESTRWQAMGWEQLAIHRLAGISSRQFDLAELGNRMAKYELDALPPLPLRNCTQSIGWAQGGWWTCVLDQQLATPPIYVVELPNAVWKSFSLGERVALKGAAAVAVAAASTVADEELSSMIERIQAFGGKLSTWPEEFGSLMTSVQSSLRSALIEREPRLANAFLQLGGTNKTHGRLI